MNKSKQQLRRMIAQRYQTQRDLDARLLSQSSQQLTDSINLQKYLVYNTSSKFHGERLKKKLHNLLRNNNLTNLTIADEHTDKKQLVTDLTNDLNLDEVNLLAKGPKFSLSNEINDDTFTELNINFCRLANRIRWKEAHLQTDQQATPAAYPQSKYISKPSCSTILEHTLRRLHHEYQHVINSIKPRDKWSNLTPTEKKTIKTLKNKHNIYLPSDKGTEFCVIDQPRYNESAKNHLNDPTTYRKIARMSAKTVESKINKVWKEICHKRYIPRRIERSYISTNTDLPRFYHLIKTHKLQQGIKIRPIVSNSNGPTTRLSWLISNLLKPMLKKIPAHLESSLELINNIQTRDRELNQQFPYPYSLDVTALYTSVPISEAIDNVIDQITSPIQTLTNEDIRALLTVILQNTYFQYDSSIYLQIEGLPMGSSLSGILAILFMDKLERSVLTLHRLTDPYKRYVDDVYAQTTNEAEADNFHNIMNEAHPRIQFEIEKPTITPRGKTLSLLDFTVTITEDGETEFEFYKKKAKKPIFMHHKSAVPKQTKCNIIRNERNRISQRCSTQFDKDKHHREFTRVLLLNEYPHNWIEDTRIDSRTIHYNRRPDDNTNWLYLRIPYICDAVDHKIRNIFKREGLPIRIIHKSTTLRQVLQRKSDQPTCKRPNCATSEDRICFRKNVVYKVTCNKCQLNYIGSTIRNIHDRINEHISKPASSVFKHLIVCGNNTRTAISVNIIARDNDPVNLRLKEALYIKKEKPQINSREECNELIHLLF